MALLKKSTLVYFEPSFRIEDPILGKRLEISAEKAFPSLKLADFFSRTAASHPSILLNIAMAISEVLRSVENVRGGQGPQPLSRILFVPWNSMFIFTIVRDVGPEKGVK